eukprot:356499-Chlamydomonas_euryale.AAC.6
MHGCMADEADKPGCPLDAKSIHVICARPPHACTPPTERLCSCGCESNLACASTFHAPAP